MTIRELAENLAAPTRPRIPWPLLKKHRIIESCSPWPLEIRQRETQTALRIEVMILQILGFQPRMAPRQLLAFAKHLEQMPLGHPIHQTHQRAELAGQTDFDFRPEAQDCVGLGVAAAESLLRS